MSTQAIVGASVAGAVGYFGAKMGANLDDTTSMAVGLGLAVATGAGLSMKKGESDELTEEQMQWEQELAEGAKGDE